MSRDMAANLAPHLTAWWGPVTLLAALIGLWLVVSAMAAMAAGGRGGRGRQLATLAAGVLLVNLPELLDVLAQTLLGSDSVSPLSYAAPAANPAKSLVRVAVLIASLVGLIGVARGVFLLRLTAAEGGGPARALVHLVGGILCVNLMEFIKVLAASLGGEAEAVVAAIVG